MRSAFGRPLHSKKAFTLTEIAVVVLVLGVLLAIAVPNFMHAQDNGNAQSCIANLKQIDTAKELCKVDLRLLDSSTPTQAQLVPAYMKSFPTCPSKGTYSINPISTYPTCSISAPIAHKIQ